MTDAAILVLQDGTVFHGRSIGAIGQTVGEVVFNTAMTGYQEILTDPSYCRQIVTLTCPHIGNVGVNPHDTESGRVHAAGLVIRDYPARYSNWRAQTSLADYLQAAGVVAIADLDTRRLTRLLRDKGAQAGCIMAGPQVSPEVARQAAREFPGMTGMDLARQVTTRQPYAWAQGSWSLAGDRPAPASRFNVIAYDFGVKHNILRLLVDSGCSVQVVPGNYDPAAVIAAQPDGVFLSNGPGDPEPCDYAIAAIQALLPTGLPIFGICLGHQLLGLACGARTVKMKFGHHGANHPVVDLATGQVLITSQNHGFAVEESSLPPDLIATHRSLFDGTLQGVRHRQWPAFSFQGHPEASPGPHDIQPLFRRFIELMTARQCATAAPKAASQGR